MTSMIFSFLLCNQARRAPEAEVRNVRVQGKTRLPSLFVLLLTTIWEKKNRIPFFGTSDQQAAPLPWPDAALYATVKY